MRLDKRLLVAAGLAVILSACGAVVGAGPASGDGYGPRVDVWTDRGTGGMYRAGESVDIHIMPHEDCYVMVYDIDTDGYVRVLFPRDCYDDCYVAGGRTYTLGGGYRRFYAKGPSGVEYIHVLASYEPFRQVYWDGCDGYEAYVREASWRGFHDYYGSALPPRIYGDPYIAMQTIDEFICTDALEAGLVWADFTYFYVGERVNYPRYLCYDCHGFSSAIRPYADVCVGFSLSFVDCDPIYSPWSWWWWCRPERVYCGPRFVCHWSGRHVCGHGCNHGHGGDHGWTDVCKDDTGRWPSEYKWKSRAEDQGRRVPEFAGSTAIRGGNIVDGARVRTVEGRDRSLYSRSEASRSAPTKVSPSRMASEPSEYDKMRDGESRGDIQRVKTRATVTNARESCGDREVSVTERQRTQPSEEKRSQSNAEVRTSERTKSIVNSIVNHFTRSGSGSSKHDATRQDAKGTKPQVRRGNEGKSPAPRRTLSR